MKKIFKMKKKRKKKKMKRQKCNQVIQKSIKILMLLKNKRRARK